MQTPDQQAFACASWDPGDPPDPGGLCEDEDVKAHDWQSATSEVLAFATKYGLGATLRMVGAALEGQPELFK